MKNRKIVLVLSGEIASGKSTLANYLSTHFDFKVLKTRDLLLDLAIKKHGAKKVNRDRGFLQKFGEDLDKSTKGEWIKTNFQREIIENNRVVIESARISEQIDSLRRAYGQCVIHVHLLASSQTLKERFYSREENALANLSKKELEEKYVKYKKDATEAQVKTLATKADLVLDTDKKKPIDIGIKTASFLKVLSPINKQLVDVLVGAQFGSEGKGQVVGHLASEYDCILRVGGPNAGHQVYNEIEGKFAPDVFHLLPSGTRKNPQAKLILGPGTVISMRVLMKEIKDFGIDSPDRLIIDPNATIISPEDISLEEKINIIGGTNQGVGAATANNILDRLRGESKNKAANEPKLKAYIKSTHEELEKLFNSDKKILLEGTQGTFLSLHHGAYPYVTSRDTTAMGCLAEAGIALNRVRKIILVTRTYPIRVQSPDKGTSGPFFNNELTWETISERSNIPINELVDREKTSTTKKQRRVAEFSWHALRKACELNSPTDIALTFVDYLSIKNRDARRYDKLTPETTQFIEEVERCSGVPVSLISTRFDFRSIIDRRNWS